MRRLSLILVAVVVASCTGPTTHATPRETPLGTVALPDILPPVETPKPTAKPLAVKVTKRTASVPRNGTASVTIKTTKKARCSITVEYKSGPSTAAGLGTKTADGTGLVTWKWRVGSRTTRGTWPIYISCSLGDREGDAETEFTVR